jgi:hypothetical protein
MSVVGRAPACTDATSDDAIGRPPFPTRTEGPEAVDQIRRDLDQVLYHGTPGQKKAIIGTHIAEIQIQGTQLIPIVGADLAEADGNRTRLARMPGHDSFEDCEGHQPPERLRRSP